MNKNKKSLILPTSILRKIIINAYKMKKPYLIVIENLSWCAPDIILNILNRAIILSKQGAIVIISGNQFILNSAIQSEIIMLQKLSQSSGGEFYKEHHAFNDYFGCQIYNTHLAYQLKAKTSSHLTQTKLTSTSPATNLLSDIDDLLSFATSAYHITHTQHLGLYLNIQFYQHLLGIDELPQLRLLTAFIIAYRYERYILRDFLVNNMTQYTEENTEESNVHTQALTRTKFIHIILSILQDHKADVVALAKLTSDL